MQSSASTDNISSPVWPGPLKGDPFKVLVADDDPVCLRMVEQMLKHCNYLVTTCTNGKDALLKLRDSTQSFDLVLSDVYMPDMDGFKLLEHVGLELDLPVIMMSSNGETSVVLRGVTHGAVDFLIKPVRIEELRNMWQHVVRRKKSVECQRDSHSGDEGSDDTKRSERKRLSKERRDSDESGSTKKQRVVWNQEMHQQFVEAVQTLGVEKAVPKKILELMPNSNLTRENVASHLQKYRAALKRGLQDSQGPAAHLPSMSGSFTAQPLDMSNLLNLPPNMPHTPAMDLATAHHAPHAAGPPHLPMSGLTQLPSYPTGLINAPFMPSAEAQLHPNFMKQPLEIPPHLRLPGLAPGMIPATLPAVPSPQHQGGLLLHRHNLAVEPNCMMNQPLRQALRHQGMSPTGLNQQSPFVVDSHQALSHHAMSHPGAGQPSAVNQQDLTHLPVPSQNTPSIPEHQPVPSGPGDHEDPVYDSAAPMSGHGTDMSDFYARGSSDLPTPTHDQISAQGSQAMDDADAIFRDQLLQGTPLQDTHLGEGGDDADVKLDLNDDMWKLLLQ